MARPPRKSSEAPAVDPAAASPIIPVESEEQSGTAREAPSTGSERQPAEPVVGATGDDVGVQPAAHMTEGTETSSAPDLSNQDQSGSVVVGELGAEVLADRAASFVAGLSAEEHDALSAALFRGRYAIGEMDAVSEPIHAFEARSHILHDGVQAAAGGEIRLDRKAFDELKAAGAIAGDWPDD